MFSRLTADETRAAKNALAAPARTEHKEFNLDIAKLLFVPFP